MAQADQIVAENGKLIKFTILKKKKHGFSMGNLVFIIRPPILQVLGFLGNK